MKFFLILLVLAFPVQAEIYKWIDEKGKTHFGDRVPEKYQKKADGLQQRPIFLLRPIVLEDP